MSLSQQAKDIDLFMLESNVDTDVFFKALSELCKQTHVDLDGDDINNFWLIMSEKIDEGLKNYRSGL